MGGSFNPKTGGTIHFSLLNNAVELDLILSMLHKQLDAELLANPRVMVLDNETATCDIVRQIPYTEQTISQGESITSTEFKEVGVLLEVTPHITRNNMMRLHIKPEFSVLVSQNENGAPTIDTRRLNTILTVRSNETVMMAGLRKREVFHDVSKVPILGDIPLIGGLFRKKIESVVNSELVVFITPKIIIEPTLSPREIENYKNTIIPYPRLSGKKYNKQM